MSLDPQAVRAALALEPEWVAQLQRQWLRLMELAVLGEVKSAKIGAAGKLRKRLLEAGERLRSLLAARDWIPHPREQLKNALGSAYALREGLAQLQRAAGELDGGADRSELQRLLEQFAQCLEGGLAPLENRWAELLDSQYGANADAQ